MSLRAVNILETGLKVAKQVYTKPVCNPINAEKLCLDLSKGIIGDTVQLTSPIAKINAILREKFGIVSKISDEKLASRVLSAVEDFTAVNKKQGLFKELNIESGVLGIADDVPAIREFNTETGKFIIKFNEKFNWSELEETTQKLYDNCQIPSNNPKCLLYTELAEFLNFRNNPYAYKISETRTYTNKSTLVALRISDKLNLNRYNANYIAGRMCGKNYPRKNMQFFEENGGNMDLRFPKPEPINIVQGSIHKFNSITDAQKYLMETYGINGDFVDVSQANLFAGAVDDITKIFGRKDLLKGLKVSVSGDEFDSVLTKALVSSDCVTGQAEMFINPAYNWKQYAKLTVEDYNSGYHPTANPKDTFIHELAHYIDFKGNPSHYVQENNAFQSGREYFNGYGKSITSKVSKYSASDPQEFCAEYICGLFNGIKYPARVNKEFIDRWHGSQITV